MTRKQLLQSKRFLEFCSLEYGIELPELQVMPIALLVKYFVEWFKCPEMLWGPRGSERERVRKAIEDRSLHD